MEQLTATVYSHSRERIIEDLKMRIAQTKSKIDEVHPDNTAYYKGQVFAYEQVLVFLQSGSPKHTNFSVVEVPSK